MFTIEHVLIAFVIMLRYVFDKPPAWVNVFFQRRHHKKEEKRYGKIQT
jgi:hypothetical protein